MNVTLAKETLGEHFKDLDILAKLLAPAKSEKDKPVGHAIEVLSSEISENVEDDELAEAAETLSLEDKELMKGL